MPQLLTVIEGAVFLQLLNIPVRTRAVPNHRTVVVVHYSALFVRGGFRVGYHPLDGVSLALQFQLV